MISQEERTAFLKLARDSISAEFSGNEVLVPETLKKFNKKQGVFVTLHKNQELRGCIGFPQPVYPLCEAVQLAAKAAAFEDPRFLPLKEEELDEIHIEISVLTVPVLIEVDKPEDYLKKIELGKDGLIIKGSYGSGLLLPQVPIEWSWGKKGFLKHLSLKAGLNEDAWQDLNNKIYKFQAEIFSE